MKQADISIKVFNFYHGEKMIHKILRLATCTCLCFLIFTGNSFSQEGTTEKDWQFNLTPFYLWGINIDGDIKSGPVTAPVDVSFSDVFDNLEAAFIVHFESMYKNQWGFLMDVNYLDLESDLALPTGISQNVDLNLTLAEFSGIYRTQHDAHTFDVIFGLRYVEVETTVNIIGGPTLVDGSKDWLDPLLGGRWIWSFADDWSLVTRGDIGGFGVGSDFSFHAIGIVEWQPFQYASFLAGYRALYMDYDEGSGRDHFNYDATVHGPIIGLNFKW